MNLTTVDSSMIHAVGYDEAVGELEVVFTSGQIWRYLGVSRKVFEALLAAPSKGQYFRANVLDLYPDRLVSGRRR